MPSPRIRAKLRQCRSSVGGRWGPVISPAAGSRVSLRTWPYPTLQAPFSGCEARVGIRCAGSRRSQGPGQGPKLRLRAFVGICPLGTGSGLLEESVGPFERRSRGTPNPSFSSEPPIAVSSINQIALVIYEATARGIAPTPIAFGFHQDPCCGERSGGCSSHPSHGRRRGRS
jgi:hypothetical protein